MADMALDPKYGASAQVQTLAQQIKGAQDPEIAQMQGWLTAWGAPSTMASASTDAAGDMAGMDMGGVSQDGMMTDAQMAALLVVANQYNLNPWTKEIYAFPDKSNGIVPVALSYHITDDLNLDNVLNWLRQPGSNASSHWVIDRDGTAAALDRTDYRDVDVRLMLDDEDYDALVDATSADAVTFLGLAIGQYLASRTGLPIDFQIQRNTEANERHHGVRNPLGHTRQLANYRGDAAPEADDGA